MRNLNRLYKTIFFPLITILMLPWCGCKGRTAENMEPTGDTIEVVILKTTEEESNY